MDDEVHHFDGRVDNAEFFHHLGEGGFEEFIIQLNDDALFAFGVVDPLGPHS